MRAYLTTYLGPVPVLCWLPEHKPPSCDGVGLVISCKGYVQLGARSCPLSTFVLCPLTFALYPLHNYQAGMGLPAWRADLITPSQTREPLHEGHIKRWARRDRKGGSSGREPESSTCTPLLRLQWELTTCALWSAHAPRHARATQ